MSDLLPTLVGIVLVACAAGFALLPLARGSRAAIELPEAGITERAQIYQQVLELEFDYQVGKLSAEDFHKLSTELLGQASELLQAERGEVSELDEEIEREILAAREAFAAARRSGSRKHSAGSRR
ncbi:MAG TPA: hypothetical protein VFG86_24885 [Chloroflexota bacterium]|jgi:hypothetical protein|nr:hypothetical protein [Chloroflexota bacterium]